MLTAFTTLSPGEPLSTAIELVQHGGQHEFPVMSGGQLVGILMRQNLLRALTESGPQSRVGDAMEPDVQVVDARDMLDAVLSRLEARSSSAVPVVHDGRLMGLLTADAIAEFLTIQAALNNAPRPEPTQRERRTTCP